MKLKKKKKNCGTRVSSVELKFMELRILENIQVELEFFEWNLSSTIFFLMELEFHNFKKLKKKILSFISL